MKKEYVNPEIKVLSFETSCAILANSFVDVGGGGTFDSQHKSESPIWDNELK